MSADLDRLAADIAAKTGAPVAQVRGAVEKMTTAEREQVANSLGVSFVPTGTKRGRPQDPLLAELRRQFPDWSQRTVARFARAHRLLVAAGAREEVRQAMIRTYTRPSGTLNVAGFEEHAGIILFMRTEETRS